MAKPIKEAPFLYDEDAKCDFKPLVIPEDETVLMFFDLMSVK